MRLKGDKRWRGVLDHEAARIVPVTLPRASWDNHMAEWLKTCKGGPANFTGFEVGAQTAEVYLPGILSLRLGRLIEWDGAAMKARGVPEADALIQKKIGPSGSFETRSEKPLAFASLVGRLAASRRRAGIARAPAACG
jgi:hypothetical protein